MPASSKVRLAQRLLGHALGGPPPAATGVFTAQTTALVSLALFFDPQVAVGETVILLTLPLHPY